MRIERFPHVIAANYRRIDDSPDRQAEFRQVIRTFASALKFVSLTALSEYLARPAQHAVGVDEFLANPNNIARPSLGQFADLLRRTLKSSGPWRTDSSLAALEGIVKRDGTLAKVPKDAIDDLIHIRNVYVHADLLLDEAELPALLTRTRGQLDALLDAFDGLADGALILGRPSGPPLVCREQITPDERLGNVRPGLWWQSGGREVLLSPFLVAKFGESSSDDVEQVLQYETLQGRQVKYVFGPYGLYLSGDDVAAGLREVTQAARQRLPETRAALEPLGGGETEAPSWERLVGSCAARSREIIDLQVALGKYLHGTYARRPAIEATFERFLASDKRLLVVVGDSGCGKTNVLCRLTQDLTLAKHAILHYYGRQYQGEPLDEMLARDMVWQRSALADHLRRCGELPEVAAGKRLVILVDAVNEFTHPDALFRAALAFVENQAVPPWIKVILTFRPVPWELVEAGFQPNYTQVYAESPSPRETRKPYVTLGAFTDLELAEAWQKWKTHKQLPASMALPEAGVRLLRQPILFRAYLESLAAQADARTLTTAEAILLSRARALPAEARGHVNAVVAAMWRAGQDFLTDEQFTKDDAIEPWMTTDQGNDDLAIFRCEVATHHQVQGVLQEVDERELNRHPACLACGLPLVRAGSRPLRRPLDFLRDEGILSLYPLRDGGEILRFTFDRMYEALTGERVWDELTSGGAPALTTVVDRCGGADGAAVLAATATGVLLGLERDPAKAREILAGFASAPATIVRQAFLRRVLAEWGRRDRAAAWDWTLETADAALRLWREGPQAVCGLRAGLETIEQFLEEAVEPGAPFPGDARAARTRARLVEAACDRALGPRWDAAGVTAAQRDALGLVAPNDLALDLLFDFCVRQANAGGTPHAVAVLQDVTRKLHGLGGVVRYRARLKAIVNWLVRLITAQVDNRAFGTAFLEELRALLDTLPFLGARQGRVLRGVRALLLQGLSVPVLAIANDRTRKVLSSVAPASAHGGNGAVDLYRILHLGRDLAADYLRCIALWRDAAVEAGDADVDLLVRRGSRPMYEPLSGVFRNLVGAIISQRSLAALPAGLALATAYVHRLPDGGEPNHAANVSWGLLAGRAGQDDAQGAMVEALVEAALARARRAYLARATSGGNYSVGLVLLQLAELFRDDGRLPRSSAFIERRLDAGDWAVAARFWDQMVFTGLIRVKPVLAYAERLVEFVDASRLRLVLPDAVVGCSFEDLERERGTIAARRAPGYDVDADPCPREAAVLNLLGAIGTLALAFPREYESFVRRKDVPETWLRLMRDLADSATLTKLRDEKMLTYAVNYCMAQYPAAREAGGRLLMMLHDDAVRRGFAVPTRKSVIALLTGALDGLLASVHGAAPGA